MSFDEYGWNYKTAKVLPRHMSEVVLITETCIGPLEENVLGIDSEKRPYESHKWLENDLYENENYCKNITFEELISKIEGKTGYFRECGRNDDVIACNNMIAWLRKCMQED